MLSQIFIQPIAVQGVMMIRLSLFAVALFASWVDISSGDCRVLADCDGGRAQWTNLARGTTGRPGKQGAPGAIGPKGEPGVGVNITEFKSSLEEEQKGPQRYYYISTLTWHTGEAFCSRFDRTLCTFDHLCPLNGTQRTFIHDVVTGDHWVPVLDGVNDWVEIGDHHGAPCFSHTARWGPPSWGITTETLPYKGYIYCCKTQTYTETKAPGVRYQYIGKTATYESSRDHCENQGRRLCYASEACKANKPVLGSVKGDKWIAVQDRFNEWIQIGTHNGVTAHTCRSHGALSGRPAWGVRRDGSIREYLGFVYCCKITEEAAG